MVHKAKTSNQFILVLIIFIGSYFFYDFIGLSKIIALPLVGILVACCYFLLQRRMRFVFKICILILLSLGTYLIPYFILKKNVVEKFENKFAGTWQTDTTGGFSINMQILRDTAYLSQSNIEDVVPYKMEITDHKFSIANKDRGKRLQWEYYFLDQGTILILYNVSDSLRLYKKK
jgi:hypothetical protein